MPFLPPNQQCQSTEGITLNGITLNYKMNNVVQMKHGNNMKLTSCVANIRTVLSENRRSQRLNKSSRVELRSSRTSALYLLHGPKCSTFGTPSVCHHTAQHSLRLMPPYTLYMLITVSRCGVMIKQFMTLLSMTSYA